VLVGGRRLLGRVWILGWEEAYGTADTEAIIAGSAASAPSGGLERMRTMKRLLLVALLVAVLLGVLAAPALATTPATDFRLPEMTAYIFAYGDGSWVEVKDVADPFSVVWHWAIWNDDYTAIVKPADPIPANYDVVMQVSIKFIPRGQVQTVSDKFLISLRIPEAGVDLSAEQAKAYWHFRTWDQYWVDATGLDIVGFNPSIGAQPYANTWLAPLTGDEGLATNLVGGKLPRGSYHVFYTETYPQPSVDLEILDHWGPTHFGKGTNSVEFTFKVGAPVK
jgi:hypothetical protein